MGRRTTCAQSPRDASSEWSADRSRGRRICTCCSSDWIIVSHTDTTSYNPIAKYPNSILKRELRETGVDGVQRTAQWRGVSGIYDSGWPVGVTVRGRRGKEGKGGEVTVGRTACSRQPSACAHSLPRTVTPSLSLSHCHSLTVIK